MPELSTYDNTLFEAGDEIVPAFSWNADDVVATDVMMMAEAHAYDFISQGRLGRQETAGTK